MISLRLAGILCGQCGRFDLLLQAFCVLTLGLIGCVPDTVTVKTHRTFAPVLIKTVGVIPFTAALGFPGVYQSFGEIPPPDVGSSEIRQSFEGTTGPIPHRPHAREESVPLGAEKKITDMVYANLKHRPGLKIISPNEVARALSKKSLNPSKIQNQILAREVGRILSLDAVITGQVRVFRERAGQKFAAIPAAVGFDVQVINAQDGTVVWIGDFFEEQKPFTQDFKGMLERGGKWVTAEELARSGVKRVIQRLPIGKH